MRRIRSRVQDIESEQAARRSYLDCRPPPWRARRRREGDDAARVRGSEIQAQVNVTETASEKVAGAPMG